MIPDEPARVRTCAAVAAQRSLQAMWYLRIHDEGERGAVVTPTGRSGLFAAFFSRR
jgi:hypothetical protein